MRCSARVGRTAGAGDEAGNSAGRALEGRGMDAQCIQLKKRLRTTEEGRAWACMDMSQFGNER